MPCRTPFGRPPPRGAREGSARSRALLTHRTEAHVRTSGLITIATFAALVVAAAPVAAGGYTHGHGSGTCFFEPSSGVEGQAFQVHASGLPTDRDVDLLVLNYEAGTH